MRVSVLQHSNGTPPGLVAEWAKARGFDLDVRRLHEGASLPDLKACEMVVILGGPMNVDDLHLHAWLKDEKVFLSQVIAQKTPAVGLCLGGQLLAQTLGAKVEKNDHWEVGWHEIELMRGSVIAPGEGANEKRRFFQWHQDRFGLAPGAVRLGTNKITTNQAFAFSNHVVGFQFHPEATREWVVECTEEKDFPGGPYVQTKQEILGAEKALEESRIWFFAFLDRFVNAVGLTNSVAAAGVAM